ncbi:Ubiquitin-like protein 3 [Vanrija pseudolonga]|uniref:Ubiquitin-like protein 3 n=1 Tax=Vanrija pseudolonga TaxID=143232 RepID=A0AAF0YFD2_9TREE|nr:Ubiquitin-like protein 3 [Vanrija pseudolonga]
MSARPSTEAAPVAAPAVETPAPEPTTTTPPPAAAPQPSTPPREPEPPHPMVHLRVLIISGQFHTFSFEPETTVGRMKELIWSMWPSEWTDPGQPPSPTWLRVLYSGRVLSDDSTLAGNNLATSLSATETTIVHLSIRSFSVHNDDPDAKKHGFTRATSRLSGTHSTRNAPGEEVSGCKCIIM